MRTHFQLDIEHVQVCESVHIPRLLSAWTLLPDEVFIIGRLQDLPARGARYEPVVDPSSRRLAAEPKNLVHQVLHEGVGVIFRR